MTGRVRGALVLCGAMVALLPAATAGAADPAPVDPAKLIDVPSTCPGGATNSCSYATSVPVHCGDKDLDTLKHSAYMQTVNRDTNPQSGSDVCSFDSNRVKIFTPTTGPITNDKVPVCIGANEYWIVPPNMRGSIEIDAWGGAGGDVLDTKTGHSALGGYGGFAAFDGTNHGLHETPSVENPADPPVVNGDPYVLTPGDVLQITVGCKPATPTGTPNASGASSANGGGGATAVRWIGHVDMAKLLADPATMPQFENQTHRPDVDGNPKLISYAQAQKAAQTGGLLDAQNHIVLAIAGGGGGAARSGGGADGELGGGKASYNSIQGLGLGQGGYSANRDSRNGSGGSSANGQPSGLSISNGGNGATPGSGGALGGVGYAVGGEGGYGAEPGGGGGGGYGGGGSGSDSSGANKRLPSGGGGGGGSFSWGGDNTASAGLRSDGMVAIQWQPSVLGGTDCYFNCRAVWPVCTMTGPGGSAGGATPVYSLPDKATGVNGYAIGAAGGGTVLADGGLLRGGSGGYAGTQGTSALRADDLFGVEVGCPGTWAKTPNFGGGGGGSTAIMEVNATPPPAHVGLLNQGQLKALAGGGGGAGGEENGKGAQPGGNGGVIGTGTDNDSTYAPGGNGGPDPYGILSGTGGSSKKAGTGGDGYYAGKDRFGGNGGYGGGFDTAGNQGGRGGAGPDAPSDDGFGGAGQTNKLNGGYGGGSGGGGGGGYGGGGGGGQAGITGGGGGGGSWTSNFVQFVPDGTSEGGFFAMLPGIWSGLGLLVPFEAEFASRIIEALAWGSEIVAGQNKDLPGLLASPKSAPFAFGYVSVQWGRAGVQAARKPLRAALRDTAGPRLRAVRMSATRFRVGTGRTATAAGKKKGIPRGTIFGLRTSEPQNVRILIERKRGSRYTRVGTIRRANRPAGYDGVPFSGRIGSRRLAPGRYRASISATDHAGNRSKTTRRSFTVVRG